LRRSSRLARTALAALCIFTLGAGVTVARLLPRRLALWQPPGIAASRVVRSAQVLGSATPVPPSARATAAGVTHAITPVISSPVFGHPLGIVVTDLASGQVLYASNAAAGFTPAPVGASEITIPAATGALDAVADKVVTITSQFGGSATKGLADQHQLSVLVDLPVNREAEFRAAIASIVAGERPASTLPATAVSPASTEKKSFVVQIVEATPKNG